MLMSKLLPCPVCGKYPKIKRDYNYEAASFGAWCTIQCKPLLRSPHLRVESGKQLWQSAYENACEEWDRGVRNARRICNRI